MKLNNLLENSVTDMGAFRSNREEQKRRDINNRLHDIRMGYMDKITMDVAGAIDQLVDAGMSQQGAQNLVAQHLENLIENISLMGTK